MQVVELFAGSRRISDAFQARGHKTFCVDWDKSLPNIDLYTDISKLSAKTILDAVGGKVDVLWMSPDCTTYSVCALNHHRNGFKRSDYAKFCDEANRHCIQLIKEINPTFWFIENPVGGMRKMDFMNGLPRYTITYCQYSQDLPLEQRFMKPTDIWTNHPNPRFKPPCNQGDKCHVSSPRGTYTGIQALNNAKERAVIPKMLCRHIVNICEHPYYPQDTRGKLF